MGPPQGPIEWWSERVVWLAMQLAPYFLAWGLLAVFRRSVACVYGLVLFVVVSAVFYAICTLDVTSRHGDILLVVTPFLQAAFLALLALVVGVEWLIKRRSPPG